MCALSVPYEPKPTLGASNSLKGWGGAQLGGAGAGGGLAGVGGPFPSGQGQGRGGGGQGLEDEGGMGGESDIGLEEDADGGAV